MSKHEWTAIFTVQLTDKEAAQAHTAEKVREARIDERQTPIELTLDSNATSEFKRGFNEACNQIIRADNARIAHLTQSTKEFKDEKD